MFKDFLKKLYSVSYTGSSTEVPKKIIKLLGIKIEFVDSKASFKQQVACSNNNSVTLFYSMLKNLNEDDLFCIKYTDMIFILSKGCEILEYKFFMDYVIPSGFASHLFEIIKLDRSSFLYKSHIDRIKNGEFLWKYVDRKYFIGHSFLSHKDGNIYIHNSHVKESQMAESEAKLRHVPLDTKRLYIPGKTVSDYLKNKPYSEKKTIIEQLIEYVFSEYKDQNNPDKISGKLFDCHLDNFIYSKNRSFHFVDFDLESRESLDKNYCIYYMLFYYNKKLYNEMLEKYNLEDKHSFYQDHFSVYKQEQKQNFKPTNEHKELRKKYFTSIGFESEL